MNNCKNCQEKDKELERMREREKQREEEQRKREKDLLRRVQALDEASRSREDSDDRLKRAFFGGRF